MAANEPLNQLSTTDANNSPAGSDVIGSSLDDELRSIKANIARSGREESTATASAAATLAVTVLNKIVPVSGSAAGSTTITLPAAATAGAGFRFTAWKTDNTNNVIIDASGAETINGSADYTMATQYEAAQFVTDGTSWVVESTAKREIGTSDLADDSVTLAKMEHGTSGDVLYYSAGGAPTRLAKGTDGQVLGLASGIPAWQEEAARSPYGLTASVNVTDSDHDLDFAVGGCWDTGRTDWIQTTSVMTKQTDASWAKGTNQGLLDSGASGAADTGYYLYVMREDSTGDVDFIMSTSKTWSGVTNPAGWSKGQFVGFVHLNSSANLDAFRQIGNFVQYNSPLLVRSDSSLTNNLHELVTCNEAPGNSLCGFITYFDNPNTGASSIYITIRHTYDGGGAGGTSPSSSEYLVLDYNVSDGIRATAHRHETLIDSNQNFEIAVSPPQAGASTNIYIAHFAMFNRLEATS